MRSFRACHRHAMRVNKYDTYIQLLSKAFLNSIKSLRFFRSERSSGAAVGEPVRAVRACHRRARVAHHLRAALALRPLDLELGASDQARSLPRRCRALRQALSRNRASY